MPNTLHQVVVSVFRDDPELAFDLLRSVFALELPALRAVSDRSAELDRFAPCFGDTGELRADVALSALPRLKGPGRFEGAALVVEIQGRVSKAKRFRLRVYQALLAERLQLPAALILVALDDRVASWARQLGTLEIPPRDHLLVLDRHNMPRVIELSEARARPAQAMLCAAIHGAEPDLEAVRVALTAALELRDSRRWRYASAILSMLSPLQRDEIKEQFDMEKRWELTERERNSGAFHDGKQEGTREGKREGLQRLLLTILELRDVSISLEHEQRVRQCEDLDQLERWIARAKQVEAATALFDAPRLP